MLQVTKINFQCCAKNIFTEADTHLDYTNLSNEKWQII